MSRLTPSSITSGFFQTFPTIPSQYRSPKPTTKSSKYGEKDLSDDVILPRILSLYLPTPVPLHIASELDSFSELVVHPSTLAHTVDADVHPPELHLLTTFGTENKISPLQTSHGWRALKDIQTTAGVIAHAYEQPDSDNTPPGTVSWNRRIRQFVTLHIWSGSSAVSTCPVAMTDGAAVLLRKHLSSPDLDPVRRRIFEEAYRRLISSDPAKAWTSGQWMTERTGGSDVRGTETVARRLSLPEIEQDRNFGIDKDTIGLPLGDWKIDGFKWFSSATDADMTILLAQTENGLSAFLAPMRRQVSSNPESLMTEMNGVSISRLKSKLGTRAVPTAELAIKGMRAHLIGKEGQGIKEISSILNITRIHTASSVSGWGRGLAVSRAYSKIRRIKGGMLLADNRQHAKWMADETVKYRAATHLYFFGVALLGASEQGYEQAVSNTSASKLNLIPREPSQVEALIRMLTPVMKAICSLRAVQGLRECMESLGGVGYCENNEDGGIMNIARLYRDATVNSIWEGTTSVMVEDVLRVIKDKRKPGVLDQVYGNWLRDVIEICRGQFKPETEAVLARYRVLQEMIESKSSDELHRAGRVVLGHFEAVVCGCLLMADTLVDEDEIAVEVAKRWVWNHVQPADSEGKWQENRDMDRRIFLGDGTQRPKSKL